MAAALPVTKIVALFVKTLAKPLSKRIKHEFSKNTTTAQSLIWIGQTSHQITSRLTIWSAGYKVRNIKPLLEEDAMKVGSEFVGEFFILSVSVTVVVWEYNRSKVKEKIKEEKIQQIATNERYQLQCKLNALDTRLIALENVVRDNNASVLRFLKGTPKYIEPKNVVPIDDTNIATSNTTTNNNTTSTTIENSSNHTKPNHSLFQCHDKNKMNGTVVVPTTTSTTITSNDTTQTTQPKKSSSTTTNNNRTENHEKLETDNETTSSSSTTKTDTILSSPPSTTTTARRAWYRYLWPF